MADDAYRVEQAPWRNTALPTMLGVIEGYAVWPIVLALLYPRWPTFWLAVGMVLSLTLIRYFGLDARSAYRWVGAFLIRALGGGRVRAVPRYWERKF